MVILSDSNQVSPIQPDLEYNFCILCRMSKTLKKVQERSDLSMTSILEIRVVWSTPCLPLLPSPLEPGEVVLVRIWSMGQINLF